MQKVLFFKNGEVLEDIKMLCLKNETLGNGTKYYTISVNRALVFVVDNLKEKVTYTQLRAMYEESEKSRTIVKTIIKKLPAIEIEFDDFDHSEGKITQTYSRSEKEMWGEKDSFIIYYDIQVERECSYEEETNSSTCGEISVEIENVVLVVDNVAIDLIDSDATWLISEMIKNVRV